MLNEEEAKDDEVHEDRLGEGKAFSGEAPDALAQGGLPPIKWTLS